MIVSQGQLLAALQSFKASAVYCLESSYFCTLNPKLLWLPASDKNKSENSYAAMLG